MFDLKPTPPIAPRHPHVTVVHGDTREDDYFYLRQKEDEEVLSYLRAENAYSDAVMAPTNAFQKALYDEMLARIQETDLSVPYPQNGWLYYTRTEEGKQYPIYCRKRDENAAEQVTLDLNELAQGEKFLSVGAYAVSDDGNLLAYSTDVTGYRDYTVRVKDLRTGELRTDALTGVDSVAWVAGNETLFYTREDDAKRSYRIYRHTLGDPQESDTLVYEEPDVVFNTALFRSRDRRYLFLGSASFTTTEFYFLSADEPMGVPSLIRARQENHEYYPDHRDGLLYVRTNENAVNFRLVTAPLAAPDDWTELIPHRPEVMLEDHDLFARHLVLSLREKGLPLLRVRDLVGEDGEHDITFPEPTYYVSGEVNREYDTDVFRFRYTSLITPISVFDYNLQTRERTLKKETPVLGGYDRTVYVSEYIHATASDGTQIPLSLVYRRDAPRDGSAPLLLYGYGSYGLSRPAVFSSNRLSLLDRGMIFVLAHIRGGGELGKPWHDAGKMREKKNTFTDFVACADFLIEQKYTASDRLAIQGGSAGGLLMGAVVNLRPELFHVVLSQVPFVDVVNTMLDDTLPLTTGEYVEWGNPNEEPAYRYMLSYSPYDNLKPGAYPTTLVKTGINDSQVHYWEPAKYVARLRTLKTDSNLLLLHVNMEAGHGGASGRYDALKEAAYDYAFLLTALGIES